MPEPTSLDALARAWGVLPQHQDGLKRWRHVAPDSLAAVLRARGADPDHPDADRVRRLDAPWRRGLEPVHVAWDGAPARLALRLPTPQARGTAPARITLEDGTVRELELDLEGAGRGEARRVDGTPHQRLDVPLPGDLPWGHHRVDVDHEGRHLATTVIRAPLRAEPLPRREWGLFLPLYALRSHHDWGIGDLTGLGGLLDWLHARGGHVAATLPLLAVFLDRPHEPGPYSPVTRRWWNELHLDLTRPPEHDHEDVRRAVEALRPEIERLRALDRVDYRGVARVKRHVLDVMRRALAAFPDRAEAHRAYVRDHPGVEAYAAFRARAESLDAPANQWPIPPPAPHAEAAATHAYAQFLLHEQFGDLHRRAVDRGQRIYLDFPLGVHAGGLDVQEHPDVFARGVSTGAPPDGFFTKGQNWGFPPMHPDGARADAYAHLRACLRAHLERAGVLRLDHVMALHRLYWVPAGRTAMEGAYVHYPSEELYAVLCLESRRARVPLVGEDLGTVPGAVRAALDRHGIHRMHVTQIEAPMARPGTWPVAPPGSQASLNTHDMPTFAAWWSARDADERAASDLMTADEADRERADRARFRETLVRTLGLPAETPPRGVLDALLRRLAEGPSPLVLVNLEDLWLELEPQNRPGQDHPDSFARRARHALEDLGTVEGLEQTLTMMSTIRRTAERP